MNTEHPEIETIVIDNEFDEVINMYNKELEIAENMLKTMELQASLMKQKQLFISCILTAIMQKKNECTVPIDLQLSEQRFDNLLVNFIQVCNINSSYSNNECKLRWDDSGVIYKYLKHSRHKHACTTI